MPKGVQPEDGGAAAKSLPTAGGEIVRNTEARTKSNFLGLISFSFYIDR
jgi:hypothetical protein